VASTCLNLALCDAAQSIKGKRWPVSFQVAMGESLGKLGCDESTNLLV
jgi:hypothetical protein